MGLKHLAQHLAHNQHLVKVIILSLIFIIIFQILRSVYNPFNLSLILFCIIAPIINYGKACDRPVVLFVYVHAKYRLISIKLWIHPENILRSSVSSTTFVVVGEWKKKKPAANKISKKNWAFKVIVRSMIKWKRHVLWYRVNCSNFQLCRLIAVCVWVSSLPSLSLPSVLQNDRVASGYHSGPFQPSSLWFLV